MGIKSRAGLGCEGVVLSLKVVNIVIYLVSQLDAVLYFTCALFASPAFLEYKR